MQVLQIVQDGNNYQDARCPNFDQLRTDQWDLDGTTRSVKWSLVDLVVRNPRAKKTNFMTWAGNKLILSPSHLDDADFGPIFRISGELLPVTLDGNKAQLLNVMPLSDCITEDECEWSFWEGKRDRLLKARFDPKKIPEGKIFKVPQGQSRLLVAHFPGETRRDDFKAIYDQRKCKGLRFRLLWDSDDPNASVVDF